MYLYFGEVFVASGASLLQLNQLCCTKFGKKGNKRFLERRKHYLDEVLYPEVLSVSAVHRGRPISTTAIACTGERISMISFRIQDLNHVKRLSGPQGGELQSKMKHHR